MISVEYQKILEQINGTENFGKRASCPKYLENFIKQLKPKTILDYGCGSGKLIITLKNMFPEIEIHGFDPGNLQFQNYKKDSYDLIVSTDVLEHIEPEYLDQTLEFLRKKSRYFYHLIALKPSRLTLPDGRNAHLILESAQWWKNKFQNVGCNLMLDIRMNHEKIDKKTGKKKLVDKYFIAGKN